MKLITNQFLSFQVISGAGHHIFADKPEVFNHYVNEACHFADKLPDDIISGRMNIKSKNNFRSSTKLFFLFHVSRSK